MTEKLACFEQIPLTIIAMEELGYIGRALTAEHDGLAAHGATVRNFD